MNQQIEQRNNTFSLQGIVIGDWIPPLNPAFDERCLLVRTTNGRTNEYESFVKVNVSSYALKKTGLSFDMPIAGKPITIYGYINGKLYQGNTKHFQILKATYLRIGKVEENPTELDMEIDDDDLPF